MRGNSFRTDIQALRGWAVSLVLLDHAGFEFFNHGFLGVDIFFVISGFLITGIIARDIEGGRFTFKEFYLKRARRILPAACVTIILTCIGAAWFLTSVELDALGSQVVGAVTYTINFVLWGQTDYFAVESNLKPLLHMWSLAVEEQFYLVVPLLLVLLPQRVWRPGLLALFVVSLAGCLWLVNDDATAAFYLLPTRAWELLIGALLALYAGRIPSKASPFLLWPGVAGLIVLPLVDLGMPHPGGQALAVCLCTAAVIAANGKGLAKSWPVTALGKLGDISYSLYLVHWPIMVFAYSSFVGEPPLPVKIGLLALSVVAAVLMYALVEGPARRLFTAPNVRAIATTVVGSVAVLAVYGATAVLAKQQVDFAALRAPNFGLSIKCETSGRAFAPLPECETSETPSVIVWGDSYAMHLVPGMVDQGVDLIQATFSACGPFLDMAPKRQISEWKLWADRCLAFNNDVLNYVLAHPEIKTVVFGSPWRGNVGNKLPSVIKAADGSEQIVDSDTAQSLDAMGRLVTALHKAGRNIIAFAPPPAGGGDTSACIERVLTGKIVFGAGEHCGIDKAAALRADAKVYDFLDQLRQRFDVQIISFTDALCGETVCDTVADDAPIYRDGGHLSYGGSDYAMAKLQIAHLIGRENAPDTQKAGRAKP